jgi:hypothetical protein
MMNTHNMVVDFGKHRGELYTRLPVSYLKWMVNSDHSKAEIAQAELDRRGTTTPAIEVSGHALDRASQQLLSKWKKDTDDGKKQGIHSWLIENAQKAIINGKSPEEGVYIYRGMKFIFLIGSAYPVLKTVMRKKNREVKHDDWFEDVPHMYSGEALGQD